MKKQGVSTQHLVVSGRLADMHAKELLSSYDLASREGKRSVARLRSASGAPASAWLTATPGATTRFDLTGGYMHNNQGRQEKTLTKLLRNKKKPALHS